MLGRVVATVGLAILAGLAFSLRDLVLPPPRQVPLPLEDLVFLSWLLALTATGWATGQLIGPPAGILAAPAATIFATGVALLAKQMRYPDAPLTGDGFEILIWGYALVGLIGGILGFLPALRIRSSERVATIGAGILVVAGLLAALPYVLASS